MVEIDEKVHLFQFERDDRILHCIYFDPEEMGYEYGVLFVESDESYHTFLIQLFGSGRYAEMTMDVYLDLDQPVDIRAKIVQVYEGQNSSPICHIYGQKMWHDHAFIVANRDALVELRGAIDVALEHDESRVVFFPSDGEGYDLYIKQVDEDFDWEKIELPYHDRDAYIPEGKEGSPQQLFERYKKNFRK